MKIQVIDLLPQDDIVTLKEKFKYVQNARVLIVVPAQSEIFHNQLDLILLKKWSQRNGYQIGLATTNYGLIELANSLQIPCFDSVRASEELPWRRGRHHPEQKPAARFHPFSRKPPQEPRTDNPKFTSSAIFRLIVFSLGVLSILVIVCFLFPSTEIYIQPDVKYQEMTMDIQASPDAANVNLSGRIPARKLTTIVDGDERISSTGKIQTPIAYASGTVTFTNLTDHEVSIPKNTIVLTLDKSPLRFSVIEDGMVKAGTGEELELSVKAVSPGSSGNVQANSITAIEGPLGLDLSITNLAEFKDGTDSASLSPTSYDYMDVKTRLMERLKQEALAAITAMSKPGDYLIADSLTAVNTLEETYYPEINQPSDYVSLSERVEYQMFYIVQDDLAALSEMFLNIDQPPGFQPDKSSLSIEKLSDFTVDVDDHYGAQFRVRRRLAAEIKTSEIIGMSTGMPIEQTIALLKARYPYFKDVVIQNSPPWFPNITILPFRISVQALDGQ